MARQLNQHAREGLTPFMLIQSALWVLLSRISGQRDFALGTPVANRLRPEWETLVGFFVNTVVLRSPLPEAGASVSDLWQAVRGQTLDALAHQALPFDRLVEALQPERQGRRNPFFNVLFAVQNAPLPALELAGLSVRALPNPLSATRLDLEIHALPAPDGSWSLLATARADLLNERASQRLLAQLEQVLARMLVQPQARWDRLDILDAEQARQINAWQQIQPQPCDSWLERLVAHQLGDFVRRDFGGSAHRYCLESCSGK